MQINLIWAQAHHRVIGKNGTMPWHLPEDLAHFKRTTLGAPVIMGRKTWDSIPLRFRPLPGRMNVVISRDASQQEASNKNGIWHASSLENALSICEQTKCPEVWVIGGAQIYALALPLAHKLVITEIDANIEGDAFAPPLDASWNETQRESILAANGMRLSFITYLRA
jgi:dihydrofolate reductase